MAKKKKKNKSYANKDGFSMDAYQREKRSPFEQDARRFERNYLRKNKENK